MISAVAAPLFRFEFDFLEVWGVPLIVLSFALTLASLLIWKFGERGLRALCTFGIGIILIMICALWAWMNYNVQEDKQIRSWLNTEHPDVRIAQDDLDWLLYGELVVSAEGDVYRLFEVDAGVFELVSVDGVSPAEVDASRR